MTGVWPIISLHNMRIHIIPHAWHYTQIERIRKAKQYRCARMRMDGLNTLHRMWQPRYVQIVDIEMNHTSRVCHYKC